MGHILKKHILLLLMLAPVLVLGQNVIQGKVSDSGNGDLLPGVNVVVKGTTTGTTTDFDGNYELNVGSLPVTLVFSSIGFKSHEILVSSAGTVNVTLDEGLMLQEVIILGNRSKPRTVIGSPVPIDNIGVAELKNTGQPTVDKMLTYKVPSFNSSTQAVSDGTAHFDPADLRGLGPSRTLVLVNGKRKNLSSLVYINDTPGKGEVGVDLKSVPSAAIERIEVLRDGASAQYGSDAIAGVINMVLKRNVAYTTVGASSGITTEGDGFNFAADVNSSINLGEDGGFLNLTLGYYKQEKTNRAGTPGEDTLFGVPANDPDWGSWLAANPDLGMNVGQPELKKIDMFFNAGVPFKNGNGELYTFGGLTYRQGTSFALYRTPYWIPDPFNLLHAPGTTYQGFQPTFETDVRDNNATVGVKWKLFTMDVDLSGTYGRNAVDYDVSNSINQDLGANSPTTFDVGAYTFSNTLANLDFSKDLGTVSIAFGAELRGERFTAMAGEPASYFGAGTQSFPGLQPSNVVEATRENFGLYGELEWEPTDRILFGGAVRYEDFSDFGDNTSWKVNGRYLLGDNQGAIRASYSTGFRAPALHQIYLSNIQTLVSGGTISNQGTFNNVDPIIRDGLGVPQLTAETSKNITAGFTYKPIENLSFAVDFYNVKIDDRVLFTNEIGFDGDATTDNPVEEILLANDITSLKFFINAVNTNTTGVDVVASYSNIAMGNGNLGVNIAANFNNTKIEGEIKTPAILASNGYQMFNRKEQARITKVRPKSKVLLGLDYAIEKWNFILNNTYFGEVSWDHGSDPQKDQVFAGKVITDLILGYDFSDKISANIGINNLLNVYPDELDPKGDVVTDLGGRFRYPWEVNQFGYAGTIINAGISLKF
ncbi:iron complex outermembrane recepter protein [Arenibacter nanhaiticus]|uniref:Iron complex outermembrane recepter protein n=1 Tax=Arenibacter nanhaiticus TaxID=558155 RepID=A0A1M6AIM4_9FLAO|nr:TonB-dependent receptor [Arenibacter nanhaiticus]SHI36330.1 iron complex outermembrane recepter protein [Arenibacter nanhaiticus]